MPQAALFFFSQDKMSPQLTVLAQKLFFRLSHSLKILWISWRLLRVTELWSVETALYFTTSARCRRLGAKLLCIQIWLLNISSSLLFSNFACEWHPSIRDVRVPYCCQSSGSWTILMQSVSVLTKCTPWYLLFSIDHLNYIIDFVSSVIM